MSFGQEDQYLSKVVLSADVWSVCLCHALITEKQEIMGLLIGEVDEEERVSYIRACVILHRSDKQPDRVEISPEQLCTATLYADELGKKLDRPMRVLGWYHSHPHITVWPSHVDVRTQDSYQMMDRWFIGLIFAVYQTDSDALSNNFKLTCFQAEKCSSNFERREIPVEIDHSSPRQDYNLQNITALSRILVQEEEEGGQQDQDDSEAICDDILTKLHNESLKTSSLVHIVTKVERPLCDNLESHLELVNLRIAELQRLKKALLKTASASQET